MKRLLALIVLVPTVVTAAMKDLDWCKVTAPDEVIEGAAFKVCIELKEPLKEKERLACHLHYIRPDGKFGGKYKFTEPVHPADGRRAEFSFRSDPKRPAKMFSPVIYVAEDGDWNRRTNLDNSLRIPCTAKVKTAAEIAAEREREERTRRPVTATLKRSAIAISLDRDELKPGDVLKVKVEYHLEPTDIWGDGIALRLLPLGPWIDKPDGIVNKKAGHVPVKGFVSRTERRLSAGDGSFEYEYPIGEYDVFHDMQFAAMFVGPDGKAFPWQARSGRFTINPAVRGFRPVPEAPGGLFAYGETVKIRLEGASAQTGEAQVRTMATDGTIAYEGPARVEGGILSMPQIRLRGCFYAVITVGDASRGCFYAIVPDVKKALGGRRSQFGCTNLYFDDEIAAADMLGMGYCRMFTQWNDLEPMPGDWRVKRLDERIEAMTKRGIRPWLTMIRPPERAIPTPDVFYPHYEPFPFDDVQWRSAATYLARRYRGKLWGFEWLNEILQGNKTKDPVGDYLRFCKIGTEAVKAVDPAYQIQMAGGLWPRNYRMDLLRAGIARYVDVLPIHYGQLEAIEEAKRDFRAGGGKRVSDNETARCLAVWNMPGPMALTNSVTQCEYVMRQCPGELVAGAEMIVYFGGWTASAGNYSYLIDGRSPRPLAATLAVMGAKLGDAVPVGSAALGDGAVAHHFRKPDGSAVAFVMTSDPASRGVEVRIPAGTSAEAVVTDHQGNERRLRAKDGGFILTAQAMPVIVDRFDGGELAKMKSPAELLRERSAASLARPELRGNLLRNGDLSDGARNRPSFAAEWSARIPRAKLDEPIPGYDCWCFEMKNPSDWSGNGNNVRLPVRDIRYLYSAWVWDDGMQCGSNATLMDDQGRKLKYYNAPGCFLAPRSSRGWHLLTKMIEAHPDATMLNVFPVGRVSPERKEGWARYANFRVTAYEGTDFAAEARKASSRPKIDGDVAEWDLSDPIPLLAENFVSAQKGGYEWSRENLSGIARFAWDADGLYFAAKVMDDEHVTFGDDRAEFGDSIAIGLHPGNRAPGTDAEAMELVLSANPPGGGSGKFTLFRPEGRTGGGKPGHLARDSSVYEFAVRRDGKLTVYELLIPWSELKGLLPQAGAKLGLTLRLNDADGGGRGARINWGQGLDPVWMPEAFGVMTLTE